MCGAMFSAYPHRVRIKAVLVIDAQVGVLESCWQPESLIARLNTVIANGRRGGTPILFVQQTDPSGELARDAPGWRLRPDLDHRRTDRFLAKQASDAFYRTDLAAVLADLAVDTLVVGGAASDYCIDATVRSAQSSGFDVDLLSDGHTTAPSHGGLAAQQIIGHVNEVLTNVTHPGGQVRLVPCSKAPD